jgi:hypothetical protein
MDITSKFTIGSDQGVEDLLAIEKSAIKSMYSGKFREEDIRKYIDSLDPRQIINELNNLSNQLIITYADDQPVGYSIIRSGSTHRKFSSEKRMTELKFIILHEHDSPEIRESLWKKTKSAILFTDIIWTNILENEPAIDFLKGLGFTVAENVQIDPFALPSYLLKLEINKN